MLYIAKINMTGNSADKCSLLLKQASSHHAYVRTAGVHMQLHWRCSLRVLDNARNPSIKEWVRDKSKAVSAGMCCGITRCLRLLCCAS